MLTEEQKRTAQAIVNVFETGTAEGDYADVTLMDGDPGHLTYGRSQTTLGSGNLYLLIKDYSAAPNAQYAADFTPYLSRLQATDLSLDNDGNLRRLLKQAGNDPVMHGVQNAFFDRVYWNPAVTAAQNTGCSLPLSVAVVYDSHIHGSWPRVRDKTLSSVGQVAAAGEQAWIECFVKTRRDWLANHSIQILRKTVYRMEAFQSLIQASNWDLEPPIVVRGITISIERAGPPLKVVILQDNSLVECHPRLENDKTRVDMRPVCDAIKVALPTGAALTTLNPVVVPPGITRVDLRPLVEGSGWEILTHKMAEDGKIYLRKKS
jgi:chitosanase